MLCGKIYITKSAPGGCRRRNTHTQTDARHGGTRAELPFSVQHKQRPEGAPRKAGACAHKNEITCAWSTIHLVCQFGDMIAHRLIAVKHIVRIGTMTARNFGLFVLDSDAGVPYNFSQC